MITTVIFDLDRTLLNINIGEEKALTYLYDSFIESDVPFDIFVKIYQKYNDLWWFKKSRYQATPNEVRVNRFRDAFEELKIQPLIPPEEISKKYLEEAEKHWKFYESADTVLNKLQHDYKLGLITNGFTKTQNKKIQILGIENHFDYICLSEDVELAKPDPKIFEHTLHILQSKPEECVFIGDDYDNDVLGAKNSGITPIWFNEDAKENHDDVIEFFHFDSLIEILENLDAQNL
jgi:putative hydrolase of the HAD superfamily